MVAIRPTAARWDWARSIASLMCPAVSTASTPPLPARNNPTSANPAIISATTTSSRVKPRAGEPASWGATEPILPASPGSIGNTHAAGQPIDPNHDRASTVGEPNATTARAAIGIETDVANMPVAPLAADCQQLDREAGRQLLHGLAPGAKPMAGRIEVEGDRSVTEDRLGSRDAQPGRQRRGGTPQIEAAADRRAISDHQGQGKTEDREDDEKLDQREAQCLGAAPCRHGATRYALTGPGH